MIETSAKLKRIEAAIPSLLRSRRKEKSLTLQALASRAGLSADFISQAERGKTKPSLSSLIQIAAALETNIDYFLSTPSITSCIHRSTSPNYISTSSTISYNNLSSTLQNQKMNGLMIDLPKKQRLPKQEGSSEVFLYVIKGEIEILIDTELFTLRSGDNVHFNSQPTYAIANNSSQNALFLWVGQQGFPIDALVKN